MPARRRTPALPLKNTGHGPRKQTRPGFKPPVKLNAKEKDILPECQPEDKVEPGGKIGSDKRIKQKKLTANQIAYQLLRENGLSKYTATKELGLAPSYGTYMDKALKINYMDKIAALMPRSVKTIKSLSMGQPVGEMADIKGSDVIAANKMIWDRAAPIVQDIPISNANSFTQININLNSTPGKQPEIELPNNIIDL